MYGTVANTTANECCQECGRPVAKNMHGLRFEGQSVTYKALALSEMPLRQRGILRILARYFGQTVHRHQIFQAVWGDDDDVEEKIIEVNISALRKKLARSPLRIENDYGIGYRLTTAKAGLAGQNSRACKVGKREDTHDKASASVAQRANGRDSPAERPTGLADSA